MTTQPPPYEPSAEQPIGIAAMARGFSLWLNSTYPLGIDPEALFHRRVGKIHEEAGEVREATGAYWQENPRKPAGPLEDVIKELADCVGAALGAIEHLTGHEGRSLDIATERVRVVCERVGVATSAAPLSASTAQPSKQPCGEIVADGCDVFDPDCQVCQSANSDAPEWTI